MPEIIVNEYVTENIINDNIIDLGPVPQMIRAHSYDDYEEEPLISDGTFEDFQNTPIDFEMPEPCEKCYTIICNGMCCEEIEIVPRQLSFKEEISLPPPPALTRIHTNKHLSEDESENESMDILLPPPPALTRMNTISNFPDDESENEDEESENDSMDNSLPPSIVLIRTYTNADLPEYYQENERDE